jgi:hypothetical protein
MAASSALAAVRAPQLVALRERLAAVVARPHVGPAMLPTGIAALDAALSAGGLPRGRLTEVIAVPGSGATSLVWQWVAQVVGAESWAAVVDARHTLSPRDWAGLGEHEGLWIVRPPDPSQAAWCADVVLRSGAFSLVVVDGAPAASRETVTRLTRLAHESDAALVFVHATTRGGSPGSAVRLAVTRRDAATVTVHVQKGGAPTAVVVPYVAAVPEVLPPAGVVADRRGGEGGEAPQVRMRVSVPSTRSYRGN